MNEIELRKLLNSFFQDIDNENKIDPVTANAIVDVYLSKIRDQLTKYGQAEYDRGRKDMIKKLEKSKYPNEYHPANYLIDEFIHSESLTKKS